MTLAEIHKNRLLLPIPGALLKPLALLMELQPLFPPPITRDQIELLKHDNVVAPGAKTLADLGITEPTPLEAVIGTYLSRSEEHTSELQSLMRISYAVFCLKKKNSKPII